MADISRNATGQITAQRINADLSDDEMAARRVASAAGSTAGSGLGAKGKSTTGMPKQDTGESMSSYSTRLRQWRETNATPAVEGQRKALKEMAGK